MRPTVNDLVNRGNNALAAGQLGEAVAHYRAALAADPALPDTWYNLGWALRAGRHFDEALDAYDRALRLDCLNAEHLRLNRAAILADHLIDTEGALAELQCALALAPSFVPAWLNLGTLHEDLGDADAARAAYRQALVHDPGCGRAHARLAMIDIAHGNAAAALDAMVRAEPLAFDNMDRAEILFALATACDGTGQYDRAFETLLAANALARSAQPTQYDLAAQTRFVDAMIAMFPAVPSPVEPQPASALRPIFMVGMFRSGSTLAEHLLTQGTGVSAGGEQEFIPALVHSGLQPYPATVPSLGADLLRRIRSDYLAELSRAASAGWVTDKRCDNAMHLGLIGRLFPEAPIVHTSRHPLDVILSTLFLHFGEGISYGHDQRAAAHFLIQQHRLMAHWRQLLGDQIIDIDYEQLVTAPAEAMQPLLARTGLQWNAAPSEAATSANHRPIKTASSWQVRKPVHRKSSGRWKNYARHLQPARAMLEDAGLI